MMMVTTDDDYVDNDNDDSYDDDGGDDDDLAFTGFSGGTRTSRSTAVIRVGAVLGWIFLSDLSSYQPDCEYSGGF